MKRWLQPLSTERHKPAQRVFALQREPAHDRASLLVSGSNREAADWIDRWPDWPAHALALHGPASSGKTHLGEIWLDRSKARALLPNDLSPGLLSTIAGKPCNILLDNADMGSGPEYEQALFHLYNLTRENRCSLLIVGRAAPARWKVALRDLSSRLGSIPAVGIAQPDDALLTTLLAKLLDDRQLTASPEVLSYLVSRMERSFAAAERVAGDLDTLSLAHQRPLTVALARMALEEHA